MNRKSFEADEHWRGSYYELSLELGPAGNDDLTECAIRALWQYPRLQGPWGDRGEFGSLPSVISIGGPDSVTSAYGCLLGPEDRELGCIMWLIRPDGDADYLDLSIPVGWLEYQYHVRYPLDSATNHWLSPLDDLLADLAGWIFTEAPFQVGWIGEEAGSAAPMAHELTAADCQRGGIILPEATWRRLSPPVEPAPISAGLVYVPFKGPHISYDV